MAPRCYPPEPEFGEDRRAERAVWEALRDQLPDEAALFHSVALKQGAEDFEADLVVAWPKLGIAVIEVKGGHISRHDGQWLQGQGAQQHPIDPVRQAEDCHYVLQRHLSSRRNPAAQSRIAHLVAFPHTRIPGDWELPGCPRSLVIDRDDLSDAATHMRDVVEVFGKGHQSLTDADLEALIVTLTGELAGQLSLLTAAEEHEQRVDQMTRDQLKVLRNLKAFNRLAVIGGAGTGKTWLALEQAHRLAKEGQRVALVCYSRGLAQFMQRVTAQRPKAEQPAYTGLFHALPLQWGAEQPPPPTADPQEQSDYYETRLPLQMGKLAESLPVDQKYDAIVVDEAQDFSETWWPPTVACLRDPDKSGLYAFLDEAQRVFSRHGEVPIPLPPYSLDENIRNTKRIAQVFGSLGKEQLVYRGLEGPPVRFMQCEAEDALDVADEAVGWLLDNDWPANHIAVLTTGKRHYVQTQAVTEGDWTSYWNDFFDGDDVFYGHVLGFKGLERPAVVLVVNGMRDESRAKEMLYVGLSRARSQLIVCGDRDYLGRLGGEGLRRRLATSQVN